MPAEIDSTELVALRKTICTTVHKGSKYKAAKKLVELHDRTRGEDHAHCISNDFNIYFREKYARKKLKEKWNNEAEGVNEEDDEKLTCVENSYKSVSLLPTLVCTIPSQNQSKVLENLLKRQSIQSILREEEKEDEGSGVSISSPNQETKSSDDGISFLQLIDKYKSGSLKNGGYRVEVDGVDVEKERKERQVYQVKRKLKKVKESKLFRDCPPGEQSKLNGKVGGGMKELDAVACPSGLPFLQLVGAAIRKNMSSRKCDHGGRNANVALTDVLVPDTLVVGFGEGGTRGVLFQNDFVTNDCGETLPVTRFESVETQQLREAAFQKRFLQGMGDQDHRKRNLHLPLYVFKVSKGPNKGTEVKFLYTYMQALRQIESMADMATQGAGAVIALQRYVRASGPRPWFLRVVRSSSNGLSEASKKQPSSKTAGFRCFVLSSDIPYPDAKLHHSSKSSARIALRYEDPVVFVRIPDADVDVNTENVEHVDRFHVDQARTGGSGLQLVKQKLTFILKSIRSRQMIDIKNVAADFIKDSHGNWWLINVSSLAGLSRVPKRGELALPAFPSSVSKLRGNTTTGTGTREREAGFGDDPPSCCRSSRLAIAAARSGKEEKRKPRLRTKAARCCAGDFCGRAEMKDHGNLPKRSLPYQQILLERLVRNESAKLSNADKDKLLHTVNVCELCFWSYKTSQHTNEEVAQARHRPCTVPTMGERKQADSSGTHSSQQFSQIEVDSRNINSQQHQIEQGLTVEHSEISTSLQTEKSEGQICQSQEFDFVSRIASDLFLGNENIYKAMIKRQQEWINQHEKPPNKQVSKTFTPPSNDDSEPTSEKHEDIDIDLLTGEIIQGQTNTLKS